MKSFSIENYQLSELDKKIIEGVQGGLEIIERPYYKLSLALNVSEEEICERLEKMYHVGFVRKNAVATNHYKLGYTLNAMTVWNVKEESIDRVGSIFKELGFASHCYERPKIPPEWNYNLFAMIHARTEEELQSQLMTMKQAVNEHVLDMDIIVSTAILKKTGIRLKDI